MRSRAILAAAVLSSALISGGWFVQRGLVGATKSGAGGASLYNDVLAHVRRDYVDSLPDSTLTIRSVEGVLEELHDPHSVYLTASRLARLSESTTGRYAGVGLQIDVRDGWITVVAPLAGGPAKDAGIQTGDRVVAVDGKPTRGFTVEEAQKTLRGDPGSTVQLTIERPGVDARLPFTLRRREIRVRSVQHALLLGNGVGYVNLTTFSEEAANDLRRAIDSLRGAGMKSLAFDLRSDPGGLLDQGVAVADLFLDPGQRIVSMRGRTVDANRDYADRATQVWPGLPLVVLVDSGTASASEIVAGALQDHTPSGRSITRRHDHGADDEDGTPTDSTGQHRPRFKTDAGRAVLGGGGITPDIQLKPDTITAADNAFERALGKHIPQFRDALTAYALSLKATHGAASPNLIVTPEMRAELLKRMEARGVTIDRATYDAAAPLVDRVLGDEIVRYLFGDAADFERRLHRDATVAAALQLMAGASSERELLDRAQQRAKLAPPAR